MNTTSSALPSSRDAAREHIEFVPTVIGNRVLSALASAERGRLIRLMKSHELRRGDVLLRAGAPIERLYFIDSGLSAARAVTRSGLGIQTAAMGVDCVAGAEAVLGIDRAMATVVCVSDGRAYAIDGPRLQEELAHNPRLTSLLHQCLASLMFELSQCASCAVLHSSATQCARWYLQAFDHAAVTRLAITHADIATLLGVRRSTVTIASIELRRIGAIRYGRRMVYLVDRNALQQAACGCYGLVRQAIESVRTATIADLPSYSQGERVEEIQ